MIKLNPKQCQKIKEAALAAYPEEMCGVLTEDDFIRLANMSGRATESFSFDPLEYAPLVSKTIAIVHSHTKKLSDIEIYDLRTPSRADMVCQKRSGKPWLIVGTEGEECSDPVEIPRTPSADYLGRPFMWFIDDCYTLVQDYFRFEMDIILPGHDESFDWSDATALSDIFNTYITTYGFELCADSERQNGDLLMISMLGLQNNHLGIYHNGQILHQSGLSALVEYSTFQNRISQVLRYVS